MLCEAELRIKKLKFLAIASLWCLSARKYALLLAFRWRFTRFEDDRCILVDIKFDLMEDC